MAKTFPTPAQITTQYLQILKGLKPTLNILDQNSDFVIRGKAFAGLVSGIYGDQKKVDNDTFIISMRPEALLLKGADFGIPRQPATYAFSEEIVLTGINGTIVNVGDLTFLNESTNILYTNTNGGTVNISGLLTLAIKCEIAGSIGNITSGSILQIVSPPAGIHSTAYIFQPVSSGSDIESIDSYRARLLLREQNPPAGGNRTDYYNFGFAGDPSVRSVKVVRFIRGLGTVGLIITTGPSDIDYAITNGIGINRFPNPTVISNVQSYLNAVVPLTDCPSVYAPAETPINVTINVNLATGFTLSSIPSDPINNPLNLTVHQLINREISRPLFKYSIGGRSIPTLTGGYVVASDIEESLDTWLSAEPDPISGIAKGIIPILADRQIQKLDGINYNQLLGSNQLPNPGIITVALGV